MHVKNFNLSKLFLLVMKTAFNTFQINTRTYQEPFLKQNHIDFSAKLCSQIRSWLKNYMNNVLDVFKNLPRETEKEILLT